MVVYHFRAILGVMKRLNLLDVYRYGIMLVLLGVVVHAPLSVYFGQLIPAAALGIKAWKELVLLALVVLAIVLISQRKLWKPLLNDRLMQLCLGFAGLHLLLLPFMAQGLLPAVAGLMIDLRFIAFFMVCFVLSRLDPKAFKVLLKTVVVGAVVVVGFGVLQVMVLPKDILAGIGYGPETIAAYNTIDSNPDFVRINSTLRGPNPLGALMVIYLALMASAAWFYRQKLTKSTILQLANAGLATGLVLFVSYSRSAWLAAVAALGVVVAVYWRRPTKKVIGLLIAALLALGLFGWLIQNSSWYHNVILHDDPTILIEKTSNSEHLSSLDNGLNRAAQQPFGSGVGSTGSASLLGEQGQIVENYYLFVAHETGWLGAGLFVGLFGLVLVKLWKLRGQWPAVALLASGVGLGLIGLLLPVWADETVALIWWGLAGSIIGGGYAKRTRQQETTRTT